MSSGSQGSGNHLSDVQMGRNTDAVLKRGGEGGMEGRSEGGREHGLLLLNFSSVYVLISDLFFVQILNVVL